MDKPTVSPNDIKLTSIKTNRYTTIVAYVPEHPDMGGFPVLITETGRSKYKPHTGTKQRIKGLRRSLKNGTATLDLEVE